MIHEALEQWITHMQMHQGKLGTTEVKGRAVPSASANGIRGGVLLSGSDELKARQQQVVYFGSDTP